MTDTYITNTTTHFVNLTGIHQAKIWNKGGRLEVHFTSSVDEYGNTNMYPVCFRGWKHSDNYRSRFPEQFIVYWKNYGNYSRAALCEFSEFLEDVAAKMEPLIKN